jgi:hypothetical protein
MIERTARQAKTRPRCSPSNSWTRTASRLCPKRRSDTAVSSSRVVNFDDRSSTVLLWRSHDSPARKASVTNPTASASPTGPGFTGRAWPITVGLPSRRATRSLPAPKEVPHHPQKRFSCGLACWHRGHGVCSAMWSAYPPHRVFSPLYTRLRPHPPSRLDLRTRSPFGIAIASLGISHSTGTDSFHRNHLNGSNLTLTFAGHGLVGQNVR